MHANLGPSLIEVFGRLGLLLDAPIQPADAWSRDKDPRRKVGKNLTPSSPDGTGGDCGFL